MTKQGRDRDLFYSSYLQTYRQRDVRDLAQVGNEATFSRFLKVCAARTGRMLNLTVGELSRVAARTVTAFLRATVDEKDLSVGLVSSIQTHGSLANWHPHLHLLVTDGGFRSDGTFVHLPLHDVTTLTEAFRRAVLKMFVKRELMDIETAQHAQLAAFGIPRA